VRLIEHAEDYLLEPVFGYMESQGLVEKGPDNYYRLKPLGRAALILSKLLQRSYICHFNVYSAVNLAEGTFADMSQDDPEDADYTDLRVAVAQYKGIDPYRMVFISMLAGDMFFDDQEWRHHLLPGSSFFSEMEEIVNSQVQIEELAVDGGDDDFVCGEDVIEDVILQGAALNAEILEGEDAEELEEEPGGGSLAGQETAVAPAGDSGGSPAMVVGGQMSLFQQGPGEPGPGTARPDGDDTPPDATMVAYDPMGPLEYYLRDARFAEAIWRQPYW
ncbi:MAG: hypothetical protein OEZ59_10000, partial [Deltaproteobacteria bacterium]|nr:hypothetical protein [Deltaproteobacteria bacterium]